MDSQQTHLVCARYWLLYIAIKFVSVLLSTVDTYTHLQRFKMNCIIHDLVWLARNAEFVASTCIYRIHIPIHNTNNKTHAA